MAELKKHALLLSLLAILIISKFIIVPIFIWQQQLIIENSSQEKKLAKITRVLTKEGQVNVVNLKLTNELERIERLFFPYQSESAFKLSQQQAFEKLLEKHQLRSSNIGWQTATEYTEQALIRYQVNIRFSGQFVDVVAMYTELESLSPWLEIDNFNISTKSGKNGVIGNIKGGRVTVNLYMHNTPSTSDTPEV